MLASKNPLLTVQSRSHLIRCNYLTEEEIYKILIAKFAMTPEDAQVAARLSGGQVARALTAQDIVSSKSPVLTLLKASAEGNEALFWNALQKWGPPEHALLQTWVVEARTGRWQTFTSVESFGLAKDVKVLKRVERALRTGARPRIAAKIALMDVMESHR